MSSSRSDRIERRPHCAPTPLRPLALGKIVATPGALRELDRAGVAAASLLRQHERGDWGELCDDDHAANVWALANGARLLSNYSLPTGERIWILTEADRSSTCLLWPAEY